MFVDPNRLSDAIALAAQAHGDALDKGGAPYILHPLRVMLRVPARARIAAVLHDVVEDTAYTLDDLVALGLHEPHMTALDLLTRPGKDVIDRPTYREYIMRLTNARGEAGDIARIVKRADIADNLGRMTPALKESGLADRYAWALHTITEGERTCTSAASS